MIKQTKIGDGDGATVRTYSDSGVCIRQLETNVIYDIADDVEPFVYTYEETDIPVADSDSGIITDDISAEDFVRVLTEVYNND